MTTHAPRRSRILAWLISATASVQASGTQAAATVRVSLSGATPFSAAELDAAVRARVPVASEWETPAEAVPNVGDLAATPDTSPPDAHAYLPVVVTSAGPHTVLLRAGQNAQVVDVGDQSGTAAARIVALVIADLIVEEIVPPAAPAQVATSPERPAQAQAAAGTTPVPAVPVLDATTHARSQGTLRLATTAGVSKGIGVQEPLCIRAEVDAGRPLIGRLVVGGVLGFVLIPRRNRGRPDELSYTAAMAEAWAG